MKYLFDFVCCAILTLITAYLTWWSAHNNWAIMAGWNATLCTAFGFMTFLWWKLGREDL